MNIAPIDAFRILSIDLCNRGVGFVVLESPDRLVDWGVKRAPINSPVRVLAVANDLLDPYKPDLLCVEDCTAANCRRGAQAKRVIAQIADLARERKVKTARISARQVKHTFARNGAFTKAQIAASVALRFPVLVRNLPPLRKPWMSEDSRMSLFDAVAFALTYLDGNQHPKD